MVEDFENNPTPNWNQVEGIASIYELTLVKKGMSLIPVDRANEGLEKRQGVPDRYLFKETKEAVRRRLASSYQRFIDDQSKKQQ